MMISLFHVPNYKIDTSKFSNLLHDNVVNAFEEEFCEYVGAKYGCSFNSATNAIFLALLGKDQIVNVPSVIPPVVCNAIENNDLMIFSFYPTKPIGSCDGGIIVSNDKDKIEWFKQATLNGMTFSKDNWERRIAFPGYKMYMNSIQCYIAQKNLQLLDKKNNKLEDVKEKYNKHLGLNNNSKHLYRINVNNRKEFVSKMKENDIQTGIHYSALHENETYSNKKIVLHKSSLEGKTTVSIPYHEKLSNNDIEKVIMGVEKYAIRD